MKQASLRALPAPTPGRELLLALAIVWIALASIPLALGEIGLSWDALNHHIYLGWIAGHPRFDRDFLAASYQSYQYPYLYWPAYELAAAGASGRVAGVVLVTLHMLAVPALYLMARVCVPGASWYATGMRVAAVVLGFSGELLLSLLDTTTNDGLAAVPFVWAVALALLGASADDRPAWLTAARCVAASGLLAGMSVAFKFSNGPLAILMPLLWLACAQGAGGRLAQAVRGSAWTLAGFALAYVWWGAQLWQHFGNPFYPFFDVQFEPVRAWLGWQP